MRFVIVAVFIASLPVTALGMSYGGGGAIITSHRPLPMAAIPELPSSLIRGKVQPVPDGAVDISLVSEHVRVDVYPSMAIVRNRTVLKAGPKHSGKPIRLGFSAASELDILESVRVEGFEFSGTRGVVVGFVEARVNGKRMPVRDVFVSPLARWIKEDETFERGERAFDGKQYEEHSTLQYNFKAMQSLWKAWDARLPSNKTSTVEIIYVQPRLYESLGGGHAASFFHNTWLTGLWKGDAGPRHIDVHLHHEGPDDIDANKVLRSARKLTADERKKQISRIFAEGTPLSEGLIFKLNSSKADREAISHGPAPYDVSKLPDHLQLYDRLIRFRWGTHERRHWEELINELHRVSTSGSRTARDIASGALQLLRAGYDGSCPKLDPHLKTKGLVPHASHMVLRTSRVPTQRTARVENIASQYCPEWNNP